MVLEIDAQVELARMILEVLILSYFWVEWNFYKIPKLAWRAARKFRARPYGGSKMVVLQAMSC